MMLRCKRQLYSVVRAEERVSERLTVSALAAEPKPINAQIPSRQGVLGSQRRGDR